MRTIALLLSCLLLLGGEGRYIAWSATDPLVWTDFSGPVDEESPMTAHTRSRWEVTWDCAAGTFELKATALFDKEGSWRKSDAFADLLAHEQLHFDIAELYARKLRRHFALLPDPCAMDNDEIRAEVAEIREDWHACEERYDAETDHSRDREAQARWAAEIRQQLQALARYVPK